MAGKNKQKKQTATSSSTANGVSYSNGYLQKNGAKDAEEEQNSNVRIITRSDVASPVTQPSENTAELHIAVEPLASCSAESQTDFSSIASCTKSPEDGLINFIRLSQWSRVETLCEIVKVLSPQEVRLVGACLEGSARPVAVQLKRQEHNANSAQFISRCLTEGRWSYPNAVKETFELICLLNSTNRRAAYAYIKLIDQLMIDRRIQLDGLPEDVRLDTLQNLGKLVTAALHHPAFTTDQCMRLEAARDELLLQYESIRPPPEYAAPGIPANPSSLIYIRRITASVDKNSKDGDFTIELQWNDGQNTWVSRSRKEISSLHHRLLDAFGDERRDESANNSFATSPDPQHGPTSFASKNHRILPYFNNDMSDTEVIEYLNGLSDLPARMMLSSVIYEEFYVSRQKSAEDSTEKKYARSESSVGRTPLTTPQKYVVATRPLSYGSTNGNLQLNIPSCSNCAGDHSFIQCPHSTIMEVFQSGKDGYRLGVNGPSEEQEAFPTRQATQQLLPPGLPIQGYGANIIPVIYDATHYTVMLPNGAVTPLMTPPPPPPGQQ